MNRKLLTAWTAFGYLYLFTPIIVIVVFSFNDPAGDFNILWRRFTVDNWVNAFDPTELRTALWYSLRIASIAAAMATVLGALVAMALSRYRFTGSKAIEVLLVLPLTTPEVVLGASLFNLFLDWGWDRGFRTVLVSHTMFCVSFVALTVKARLRGHDWSLEDAAMDLGAGPMRTFVKVTFPLIIPGVLAAYLLSFALSIDDFIITFFTKGSDNTFPLQVFGESRRQISPQINVLATLVLLVSLALFVVPTLVSRLRRPPVPG